MEALLALWVPILLAAVLMFVVSSIAWTVLPHHKRDWAKVPNEPAAVTALTGVARGQYVLPKEHMHSDWAAFLLVRDRRASMGKSLFLHFLNQLMIAILTGYILYYALPPEADYLRVFRVAGTALLLGQVGALFSRSIFWGWSWRSTLKEVVDGIVYALLAAGVFGWWWVR